MTPVVSSTPPDRISASDIACANDPESMSRVANTRVIVCAIGHPEVARVGTHPGGAAQNALTTVRAVPDGLVPRRTLVILMPAVCYPLRHVANQIVQTKLVRGISANRRRPVRLRPACLTVSHPRDDLTTPPVGRRRARAGGVFPFRFSRQAVGLRSLLGEPAHVVLRIVVAHVAHRLRILPERLTFACTRCQTVLPLSYRDRIPRDGKCLHRNAVYRPLATVIVATHHETTARHVDHLRNV